MNKFKKFKEFSGQEFVRELRIFIAFFIGIVFFTSIVGNFSKDTSIIFNVAFGVTVIISGLCFGMSANIDNKEKEDKRRMAYAGERLFHAAILFAIGSLLKYTAIEVSNSELLRKLNSLQEIIESALNIFAVHTFLSGLNDSHMGIKIANRILGKRLYSDKDWDSF